MDYYKILGVGKSDNTETIKRRFRELSLVHHPDKGGDLRRYQEITEAYVTLVDRKKRKAYDETLKVGSQPRPKANSLKDVFFDIYVGLFDAVHGCVKTVEYGKSFIDLRIPAGVADGERIVCKDYNRSGINVVASVHVIPDRGYFFERYRNGRVLVYNLSISPGDIGGTVDVELFDRSVSLSIPEGVTSGRMLKLKGAGYTENGTRGDLYIRLCVKQ